MNRLFLSAILLFLFSGAKADSVSVEGFDARPQEMSNWCWAASIQSLFLTRGLKVEQADIVVAAYGRAQDGTPPNRTAPGFDGTLRTLNGLSVGSDGSLWRIKASAGASFPNSNWLHRELSGNKPVMIWYKDENSNHSIVVNGGEYFRDTNGNVQWLLLTAYDPWFDRNMKINAANIPRYVYGTFIVELNKLASPTKTPGKLRSTEDKSETSNCPKETTPYGYIRAQCEGITKRVK